MATTRRYTPEMLFANLVKGQALITYKGAYELIIGDPLPRWQNRVHVPPLMALALGTTPRDVNGLRIRLDALIVTRRGGAPEAGHFTGKAYDESTWRQTFGDWVVHAA